ncbi:13165_t:CDS:2, partial [Acaulospora colombiana]
GPSDADYSSPLLDDLDLTPLRCLSLNIEPEIALLFMDLALKSTQSQLNLEIRNYVPSITMLEHKLMERCVTFMSPGKLNSDQDPGSYDRDTILANTPQFPPPIPLPRVTKWVLEGELRLLESFDFGGAQSLEFVHAGFSSSVISSPIPGHLTELYIAGIKFTSETSDIQGNYHLPNLTSLRMDSIGLEGSLQDYLKAPKLKLLHLTYIYAHISPQLGDERGIRIASASVLYGLFEGLSQLECLALQTVKLNGKLARDLGKCLHLKVLGLTNCATEKFIPTFVQEITDKEYLPRLSTLNVFGSWSSKSGISCTSFMKHCRAQRPGIDANRYVRPGDDVETETDDDSESDEDFESSTDSTNSDTDTDDETD